MIAASFQLFVEDDSLIILSKHGFSGFCTQLCLYKWRTKHIL